MGDMARYLDELDAKSQDYAVRVQIACAQAIIEAINEQTDVLLGRFDDVIRARADGIGVRDEGGTTVIELPSLSWPDAVAAVIDHLERQVAVIKESLKTAAPPADAATEAVREAAVEAWARLAVALLSRHESAWDHDPGPGDDDCDEDCRACEYVGLLRTGRSALAARRGDV